MSDEAAKNIPPEKLVRVTFMPEGKTVRRAVECQRRFAERG